jgi:hypothetical protein
MRLLHSQKKRAEITAKTAKMTPDQMLPVSPAEEGREESEKVDLVSSMGEEE